MVSNAKEDLPDPDSPVMQTRAFRGSLTSMSLRLCSRAPWTISSSAAMSATILAREHTFVQQVPQPERPDTILTIWGPDSSHAAARIDPHEGTRRDLRTAGHRLRSPPHLTRAPGPVSVCACL